MPIAAVPKYMKQDFSKASPGMRYGMYLPIWTTRRDQEDEIKKRATGRSRQAHTMRERLRRDGMDAVIAEERATIRLPDIWSKNDKGAAKSWKTICSMSKHDAALMDALAKRQLDSTHEHHYGLLLTAVSTAPLTTGLGNEHPLENGFSFLWPYGLPCLAGSSIKGVLRQALRELSGGDWGGDVSLKEEWMKPLFGSDDPADPMGGALTFQDVIPRVPENELHVEVMTPHHADYFRDNEGRPHDSEKVIPIKFLALPPETRFTFRVDCDVRYLASVSPELAEGERWREVLISCFEHTFDWLGFGAKTAVGYGAMKRERG